MSGAYGSLISRRRFPHIQQRIGAVGNSVLRPGNHARKKRNPIARLNIVPAGGDAMSKIPELKTLAVPDGHVGGVVAVSHPASTSRSVSSVASVGLLDPNLA